VKLQIKKGSTSVSLYVFIQDSSVTTGAGLTGLVFNTASLTAYYVRPLAAATAITLATLAAATSVWASGGFKEVDATNMPGVYRLDIPDAVIATGVNSVVVMLKGASNMAPVLLEIGLVAYDPQSATDLGLTTLAAAATQTSVNTIDDLLDTEVAAIKTVVDAIKVKTDSLTFTTALKLDCTIQAAGDFAQAAADKVWTTAARTLTAFGFTVSANVADKTGFSLSTAGILAIWHQALSAIVTAGSVGKLIKDYLDAAITSRSSQTSVDTVDDLLDTEVAAIKAKTDQLTFSSGDIVATLNGETVTVATNNDKTGYALSSAGVDAILDDAPGAELASVPSSTASLRLMIQFIFTYFRHKKTVTATTETVFKDDGSTTLGTATISDVAGTFTKGELT